MKAMSPLYQQLLPASALLPRIRNRVVLPNPDLRLLLAHDVLHEDLPGVLCLVLADPAWIPEFARNAEVLATPHQCVGPTSLSRGGNAIG